MDKFEELASGVVRGVGQLTGPTAIVAQVDNGFTVLFIPKPKKRLGGHRAPAIPLGGFPYGRVPSGPSPGEIAEMQERQKAAAIEAEKRKTRLRVYPALSEAMKEIEQFYKEGEVPNLKIDEASLEGSLPLDDAYGVGQYVAGQPQDTDDLKSALADSVQRQLDGGIGSETDGDNPEVELL